VAFKFSRAARKLCCRILYDCNTSTQAGCKCFTFLVFDVLLLLLSYYCYFFFGSFLCATCCSIYFLSATCVTHVCVCSEDVDSHHPRENTDTGPSGPNGCWLFKVRALRSTSSAYPETGWFPRAQRKETSWKTLV